jgi:hypothetical protein
MDPALLTKQLGLRPQLSWLAGGRRETAVGEPLPGVHKLSTWGYMARVSNKRHFFESIIDLLVRLEKRAKFVSEVVNTGGQITLLLHLPGDANIGDVIGWRDLQRLGHLSIDLGVEVFPQFN